MPKKESHVGREN